MAPLTVAERMRGIVARVVGRLPARVQQWIVREPPVVVDGQRLDPMLQLIRRIRRDRGFPGYCRPTVAVGRTRTAREMRVNTGRRTRVRHVRELVIPADDAPVRARLYEPVLRDGAAPTRSLLVYLHGGGFVLCDVESYDEICRRLSDAAGVPVLSVDYRLAPEHPFPAGLRDAAAAFRWARDEALSLGVHPDRVAIGGDSAGGTLAAVVARSATQSGRPPFAQLLVYPATDAVTRRPSHELFGSGFFLDDRDREDFAAHYVPDARVTPADPRISPLLADDLHVMPPTLIVTAGFDILRDEGDAYAEALASAGVPVRALRYPSLGHAFVNMVTVSSASAAALREIGASWDALLREASLHAPRAP